MGLVYIFLNGVSWIPLTSEQDSLNTDFHSYIKVRLECQLASRPVDHDVMINVTELWTDVFLQYQFLAEILKWRAQTMADHTLFTLLNAKVSRDFFYNNGLCINWYILTLACTEAMISKLNFRSIGLGSSMTLY